MRLSWPLGLYRVSGESMEPSYKPGRLVVGLRCAKPHRGDVVVADFGRLLIKRVGRIETDGGLWLLGDNPGMSSDSRDFGPVPPECVKAVILFSNFVSKPSIKR
jgi:phage repressor protein C with HTH and peptisase S24 domain